METDHPTDLLAALALGCLEEEERQEVRRHVRRCADCRRELSAFQDVTLQLAFGAPAQNPPDRLRRRLRALIGRRQKPAGWLARLTVARPRLITASILASLVLVVALGAGNLLFWLQMDRETMRSLEHVRTVWLMGAGQADGAVGSLVIVPNHKRAVLVVHAMALLDADSQYQLWLIKDGRRTSGGVFSVSERGSGTLDVVSDRPLDQFDAFGVTIEPLGGSPGPTGRKVLGGNLKL